MRQTQVGASAPLAPPTPPHDSEYNTRYSFHEQNPQEVWLTAMGINYLDLIQKHNRVSVPIAADERFISCLYDHVLKSFEEDGFDTNTAIGQFMDVWRIRAEQERSDADDNRMAVLARMTEIPLESLAIVQEWLRDRTAAATNTMILEILPLLLRCSTRNSRTIARGANLKSKVRKKGLNIGGQSSALVSSLPATLRRSPRFREAVRPRPVV